MALEPNIIFSAAELLAARDWLARMRDPEVTEPELEAFEIWLGANPRHSLAFRRAISQAARGLTKDGSRDLPMRTPRYAAASAALAAAALVALAIIFAPATTYATAIGDMATVPLRDGGAIVLNTDTQLSLRASSEVTRARLERGEAFFDSAYGTGPIVVQTEHATMRANGADFDVRIDPAGLHILVIEGAVDIDMGAEHVELNTGERLILADGVSEITRPPTGHSTRLLAWRAGMLEFASEPLSSAAQEISRYTGARIVIDDPRLLDIPITARIRTNDLDRFIETLEAGAEDLAVERRGDHVVIRARRSDG